jgi:hypothetical protein
MKMSQGNSLYSCLTQTKMSFFFFFFKNKEQEGKTDPVWGLAPVGWGHWIKGKLAG